MTIRRETIRDSRGADWEVTVSGPYRSGNLREGGSLDDLPEKWRASFRRSGGEGEITMEVAGPNASPEELRAELERDPEWQHEDWAQP